MQVSRVIKEEPRRAAPPACPPWGGGAAVMPLFTEECHQLWPLSHDLKPGAPHCRPPKCQLSHAGEFLGAEGVSPDMGEGGKEGAVGREGGV